MKTRILTCMALPIVLMLGCAGCEESLTPADIQALAAQQEVLQQQVEIVQAAATQMAEDLVTAEIMDPDVVAKIAEINKEADKIQAQIALIAQALQGVPLTGDTAQDFIAQLQAANTASSGFNPYVVPVGAGLSILSIFLGWLARRNAGIAAGAQAKYQAHKQGVEKTMKEGLAGPDAKVSSVIESRLYNNIGKARADLNI